MILTESQAELHLAGLFASACGMLSLFVAGGDRDVARAAALIVLHLSPEEDVRERVHAAKPEWVLFSPESIEGMRTLAQSVLLSRPKETSH